MSNNNTTNYIPVGNLNGDGNSSGSGNAPPRRNPSNQTTTQHTDPSPLKGNISEIGAVLGLKYEMFKRRAPSFETFLEKVSVYVISNLKDGGDTKSVFRKIEDPTPTFRAKNKPKAPDIIADNVDKDIYKEEIKIFVSRELNLRRNLENIFGIIWGQCSSALQSNIKSINDFEDKYDLLDTLWLIKELKKATSGIDSKSYPEMNLIDSLTTLLAMKQSNSESNDRYLERFKSNINTVELAHGAYILCPENFIKAADSTVGVTSDDRKKEREKMKAALLLKTLIRNVMVRSPTDFERVSL